MNKEDKDSVLNAIMAKLDKSLDKIQDNFKKLSQVQMRMTEDTDRELYDMADKVYDDNLELRQKSINDKKSIYDNDPGSSSSTFTPESKSQVLQNNARIIAQQTKNLEKVNKEIRQSGLYEHCKKNNGFNVLLDQYITRGERLAEERARLENQAQYEIEASIEQIKKDQDKNEGTIEQNEETIEQNKKAQGKNLTKDYADLSQ